MKKGFTLVELLAVIIVLGIVLVIAVPKLMNISDSTQLEISRKEAENIMNTAKMHAVDTGDFSVLDINSSIFEKRGIANEYGYVQVNNNEQTRIALVIDDMYCVYKDYDASEPSAHVLEDDEVCGVNGFNAVREEIVCNEEQVSRDGECFELAYLDKEEFWNVTDDYWHDIKTISFYNDGRKVTGTPIDISVDQDDSIKLYYNAQSKSMNIVSNNKLISFPEDSSELFWGLSSVTSINFSHFIYTSNVTDMSSMFNGCDNLESLDLSSFNTGNVTNMEGMFCCCYSLTKLNLSNFNTSKVTNMEFMFQACESLKTIDLSGWDTSNVTSMINMFGWNSFESLDDIIGIENFDMSNVDENWYGIFCSMEYLNAESSSRFSGFDTHDLYSCPS